MSESNGNGHRDGSLKQLPMEASLGAASAEYAEGAVIYEASHPATNLYFIDRGQVRTYEAGPDASARMLEILGPGDWFGEAALAATDGHSSRAVAASPAVLWTVPVDRLMELLTRSPNLAAELIRQLALRLQSSRQDASRFVFDDCSARLVKALLRFSTTAAATPQENGDVLLRITHRQLAQAVGAARETVSLALTELRQKKLLQTGRNRLLFKPEALRDFAADGA
jgi:CRP/FNR family transcriptional regulator